MVKMLSFQAIIDKRCYEGLNETHYFVPLFCPSNQKYNEKMMQMSSASNQIFSTHNHSKETCKCVKWRYYIFYANIRFYEEK